MQVFQGNPFVPGKWSFKIKLICLMLLSYAKHVLFYFHFNIARVLSFIVFNL